MPRRRPYNLANDPKRLVSIGLCAAIPVLAGIFMGSGLFFLLAAPALFACVLLLDRHVPPVFHKLASAALGLLPFIILAAVGFRAPFIGALLVVAYFWSFAVLIHFREEVVDRTFEVIESVQDALVSIFQHSQRTAGVEYVDTKPKITAMSTHTTKDGVVHSVSWVDFVRLRFEDRANTIPIFILFFIVLAGHAFLQYQFFRYHGFTTELVIEIGLAIVVMLFWAYVVWHQRRRYSHRSVVFYPDGSIRLINPPPYDAELATEGSDRLIPGGLRQITSIEYTKTADWLWIDKDSVRSVEHWYDVHLFLGEDWRISLSRNLGSRDHAHHITGALNALRSRLMRSAPTPGVKAGPSVVD